MPGIKIYDSNTNKHLSLEWADSVEKLKQLCLPQQGPILWKNIDVSDDQVFFENLQRIYQERWDKHYRFLNYNNKLKNSKVVVEVGSGIGIHSLLLSQAYPDITFYLVDRNKVEPHFNLNFYNEDRHGFYNDFSVTEDCINASGLDKSKFIFLNPTDDWPQDIDLVYSFMSYCWHYGKKHYWNKIQSCLNTNGNLVLDIFYQSNAHNEISKEFGDPKLYFEFKQFAKAHNSTNSQFKKDLNGTVGARFTWVKP